MPTQQAFNWLVVGAQKTAKTTTALQMAAFLQQQAIEHEAIKKVIIFDPMFHESFEIEGIHKAVRFAFPHWKIPSYRMMSLEEIQYFGSDPADA